jgi:interferon-induced transmembrane protein
MTIILESRAATPSSARATTPEAVRVRSHLALAVACTLVCFAPLGVAAVVQAGNARTRIALGDVAGARRASRIALWLCCASVVTTLGFLAVIVIGSSDYSDAH